MSYNETPTDTFTRTVEETVTENLVEDTNPAQPHPHPGATRTITKTVRKSTLRNGRLVSRSFSKKTVETNSSRPLESLADDLQQLSGTPDAIDVNPVVHDAAQEQPSHPPHHVSEPNPPITPTNPPTNTTLPANPTPILQPRNNVPLNPTNASTPNTPAPGNHSTVQTSQQHPSSSDIRPNSSPPASNPVQLPARNTPSSSRPQRSYAAETRSRHIAALAAQSAFRSRYEHESMPSGVWWVTAHKQCDRVLNGFHRKMCHGLYSTRKEAIERTKQLFETDILQYSYLNPTEFAKLGPIFDARGCWQVTYKGGFLYDRLMATLQPESEGLWVIQVIGGNFGNPESNILPKEPASYWVGPFLTREQAVMEGKDQMARKSTLSFEKVAGDEDFYLQEDSEERWSVFWSPLHLDYVQIIVTKLGPQ